MTAAITTRLPDDEAIELALVDGDLSRLTSAQRRYYYLRVCESVALNPLTKPFEYIRLNGKLVLYATKGCTHQLRGTRGISISIVKREVLHGICEVTARAITKDGREDTDVGAVFVDGLRGEALANAVMKAYTKAKRRVTLSISGLSMLDESELESVRGVERMDFETPAPQLPAAKSTPPPPMHDGGPASALWSAFKAELTQAPDEATLTAIGKRIKVALDAQHLTLTQGGDLRELVKARKKELKAPKSVAEVLAGNELPESWGGPPEAKCLVCGTAIVGDEPALETTTPDGEVGRRHRDCGWERQPGDD
jgi:hypothetical protein